MDIQKIFHQDEKQVLGAGVGVAVAIIDGLTRVDWQAAWPGIQRALIGLGAGAIAYLQRHAIGRGLNELAARIAAFEPVATRLPEEAMSRTMPYLEVWDPAADAINLPQQGLKVQELGRAIDMIRDTIETGPPNCNKAKEAIKKAIIIYEATMPRAYVYPYWAILEHFVRRLMRSGCLKGPNDVGWPPAVPGR